MTPRPPPRRPTLALRAALAAGALGACAPAHAADNAERILLDLDLRPQRVTLTALDSQSVSFTDESGRARRTPTGALVALLPVEDPRPSLMPRLGAPPVPGLDTRAYTGLLVLTDGQRFPGQRAAADGAETLVWRHPRLGRVAFPLDAIASVVLDENALSKSPIGASAAAAPDTRDAVLLSNGDLITGFLLSLGEPVSVETDAGPVAIPSERVVAVRTANPASPMRGQFVWLDDGTVASVASIEPEGEGAVAIRLAESQSARYAIGAVEAVAFDASRIVPLASLTPRSQAPEGDRADFRPIPGAGSAFAPDADTAPLRARDIELPGPMTVTWALPADARRFAARAVLPGASRPWGDCEFVVRIDGVEALRERLSEERPSIEFALPAAGRELSITVEPGAYGPINDRVIVRRAIIIVGKPAG